MTHEAVELPDEFGSQVKSALFWRSGSQIVSQIIAWGSTLIVIRLLSPADYGLFAMTQVVLAFLTSMAGYGFARSLIQADTVTPKMIRQVLGLLIVLNGSMAIIQYFAAPFMAAYYKQPQIADLLRVQLLIFCANPFMIVSEVLLSREMKFRPQAVVNLCSAIAGAVVALSCAVAGFGVWTLVFAPIAGFWTRALGLSIGARLIPIPSFDFRGTGDIMKFGLVLLSSHIMIMLQSQSDIFFAARKFDAHAIGLYSEALFLVQIFINKFIPALNDVAFPAYSQIQSNPTATRWAFLKSLRLIFLVCSPIFLGLAATSQPLVLTLFGQQWGEMAPYVTILAIAMPFMAFQVLLAPLNNALGRPDLSAKSNIVGLLVFPACVLIGLTDPVIAALQQLLHTDGAMIGVVCAWLISCPLLALYNAWLTQTIVGFDFGDVGKALGVGLLPAAAMAACVFGISRILPPLPAPVALTILIACGVVLYAGFLWFFQRQAIDEIIDMVRKKKRA